MRTYKLNELEEMEEDDLIELAKAVDGDNVYLDDNDLKGFAVEEIYDDNYSNACHILSLIGEGIYYVYDGLDIDEIKVLQDKEDIIEHLRDDYIIIEDDYEED